MFFDDLHILRTIDRLEQAGSTGALMVGTYLLPEVTGGQPVIDERDCRNFVRELQMAREGGFLTFKVMRSPGAMEPPNPDRMAASYYRQQLQDFHLTPIGRDRARCRVYEREPPDPGEDDGRPITQLTFRHIAEILAGHYAPDRLKLFLEDSGIAADMLPPLDDPEAGLLDLFRRLMDRHRSAPAPTQQSGAPQARAALQHGHEPPGGPDQPLQASGFGVGRRAGPSQGHGSAAARRGRTVAPSHFSPGRYAHDRSD